MCTSSGASLLLPASPPFPALHLARVRTAQMLRSLDSLGLRPNTSDADERREWYAAISGLERGATEHAKLHAAWRLAQASLQPSRVADPNNRATARALHEALEAAYMAELREMDTASQRACTMLRATRHDA